MNSYNSGESFIDHIYQELINSDEVKKAIQRRGVNPKNREEAVRYYMERMQNAHNTQRKINILKRFYYKKYVIDHLPENYVEHQWRIAREQGMGNIRITDEIKSEMLRQIQEEQKKSIDNWLTYLNSADAMYPMWFKFYAFQGMLKLGQFDKAKKKFRKRTKDTTSPYIDVNPEVLGQMYTLLSKMISNGKLNEEEVKALENGESFQRLYTYLLIQMEEHRIVTGHGTEGIWIKYDQGSNYQQLWQSLQGKNTGWCTAGEETCKRQIKNGDFYVYYTYDKDGNPTEPRIAIRMNGQNEIAEVRGIGKDQNIEPEMIDIAEAKLKEFPNKEGEKYQKKSHDMKLLTQIEEKTNNNEELTEEEIIFLYEIKSNIEGFGWGKDPRIKEIISKRNVKDDFRRIKIDEIISGVRKDWSLLRYIPKDIPNYEQIVLEAVKNDGMALIYATDELKSDREIVLEAVKNNGWALRYASDELKSNREIVLEAVKNYGKALLYASHELRADREIVLEAVKNNNGMALIYAADELKSDREIVLEAVKNNGMALIYAADELKSDREIALEAIKQDSGAYKYISKELKNDPEIRSLESIKQYFQEEHYDYLNADINELMYIDDIDDFHR